MITMRGGNDNNKNNNGDAQDDNDTKKGEGVVEGSKKPEDQHISDKSERLEETAMLHSDGSDSDSGKDNEMEAKTRMRMRT
jgi:hypothetical protein